MNAQKISWISDAGIDLDSKWIDDGAYLDDIIKNNSSKWAVCIRRPDWCEIEFYIVRAVSHSHAIARARADIIVDQYANAQVWARKLDPEVRGIQFVGSEVV